MRLTGSEIGLLNFIMMIRLNRFVLRFHGLFLQLNLNRVCLISLPLRPWHLAMRQRPIGDALQRKSHSICRSIFVSAVNKEHCLGLGTWDHYVYYRNILGDHICRRT